MRTSWTYARVAGIPLKVHLNWFIAMFLVTISLAAGYFPQEFPGWSASLYWSLGVFTGLLFFLSVLLHEFGHALVSMDEGVPVNSITLFIFGGVAHIAFEPKTPGSEFRIVAAGPLTSLLLALTFYLVSLLSVIPPVAAVGQYLSRINLILAVFNLLPGFPLDGGRLLRAALWRFTGSFRRATRWATNVGVAISLGFIIGGVIVVFIGSWMAGLWIAFIGWYLFMMAVESYRQARETAPAEAGLDGPLPEPGAELAPRPALPATWNMPAGRQSLGSAYVVLPSQARFHGAHRLYPRPVQKAPEAPDGPGIGD